jgi:hypothetical protein
MKPWPPQSCLIEAEGILDLRFNNRIAAHNWMDGRMTSASARRPFAVSEILFMNDKAKQGCIYVHEESDGFHPSCRADIGKRSDEYQ